MHIRSVTAHPVEAGRLILTFSGALPAGALDPGNYSIDGLAVTGVGPFGDGVELLVEGLEKNSVYLLAVSLPGLDANSHSFGYFTGKATPLKLLGGGVRRLRQRLFGGGRLGGVTTDPSGGGSELAGGIARGGSRFNPGLN